MGPFFLFFFGLFVCLVLCKFFKKIDFHCLHKIVCLCFLHQQRSFVRCCCRVVVAVVVVSSGSLLKIVTIFCILLLLLECARCLLLLFALCSFASSCVFSHQFSVFVQRSIRWSSISRKKVQISLLSLSEERLKNVAAC